MEKNVAGQIWIVFAFDRTDNTPLTGDAAQITGNLRIDGGAANAIDDTNPTELEDGYYAFELTQAETDGDLILIAPVSSTSDIQVIGVPGTYQTVAPNSNALGIESDGDITQVNTSVDVTNQVSADVTAISGDTTAADNLESQYDETGLAGDTFPSTQAQILNIANVGSAVSTPADSYSLTTGNQTANAYTDTKALDGVRHTHTDAGGALVLDYGFNIGSGTPSSIKITGALTSGNDDLEVLAYDFVAAAYVQIGILEGKVSSANEVQSYDLYTTMVGTGANLGDIDIRLQDGAYTLSSATLYIDQIYASFSGASSGYELGSIWVNDSVTNTSTVPNVDGVATNPVSTWSAALTLSALTNIDKFQIANGTGITLSANSDNFSLNGFGWTLALGGQSIEGSYFEGAIVTGIATATVTPPKFKECRFGAVTLPPCGAQTCGFGVAAGQFTAGSAGQYAVIDGFSLVPGAGSPALVFSGLGATTGVNVRRWAGGATYTLDSDCTLSHEVVAGGGTTITTGGGDVEIRGITRSVTITASGAETVQFVGTTGPIILNGTTTATFNLYGVSASVTDNTSAGTVNDETVSQETIPDVVWDESLTAATHNVATSAGRRLRDIASNIVLTGTSPDTAGTANTNIRIELDGDGSSTDGAYDPAIVVITGGTGVGQSRQIFEYDGTNKYAYVNRAWKVIPDDTSVYTIVGDAGDTHVNEGLATGGGNNTITINALASAVDDTYIGQIVFLSAGTGEDQSRMITDYDGTSKVVTVERNWETNPASGDTIYAIIPTADLTETISQLNDMSGATFNTSTDSLEAIRDRGDAAWTTGAGGSSPTVEEIRTEMDDNSTQLAAIVLDTGTTLPAEHGLLATEAKQDIIDTNVDAVLVDTNDLQTNQGNWATATGFLTDKAGFSLSTAGIDAILDEQIGDGTITMRESLRGMIAILIGESSGGGTATLTFRNNADTQNVQVATVNVNGDRTATTFTP